MAMTQPRSPIGKYAMTRAAMRLTIAALREMQELAEATLNSLSPAHDYRPAQLRSSLVKVLNPMGYDAVRCDRVNQVQEDAPDPGSSQTFLDWAGRPCSFSSRIGSPQQTVAQGDFRRRRGGEGSAMAKAGSKRIQTTNGA